MKPIILLFPFLSLILASCGGGSGTVPSVDRSTKVRDMPVAHADPNIFKQYNAKGDSKLTNTWTRKFDASGISFNDKRTCTLITRRHVVMATHYGRPSSIPIVFHDRNGKYLVRYLIRNRVVHGDCMVGLLDQPVPSGYKVYPMLRHTPSLAAQLQGELVLTTDQGKRLFVHEISSINGSYIRLAYDKNKQIGYGRILRRGDSGNPTFVMVNGEPVIIETHHTGGAGAGPFFGGAELQQKLSEAINILDPNYQPRYVNWR